MNPTESIAQTVPDVHLLFLDGEPTYRLLLEGQDVTGLHPRPVHHAPSGISWGYGGSGPADLALLILALHLPVTGALTREAVFREAGYPSDPELEEAYEEQLERDGRLHAVWDRVEQQLEALPVETYDGKFVSRRAWELHLAFKWAVIAPLAQEQGHVLTAASVREWMARQQ